jgi:membrane-associated phospholipid phosphatase
MTVLSMLAAIVVSAFIATEVLPWWFAVRLTRSLAATHAKLDGGNRALSRLQPIARLVRLVDTPLLVVLAALVVAGLTLFIGLLDEVAEGAAIVDLDARLFHFLQTQRTPSLDRFMIAMTGLGDQNVVMPVALAGLVALTALQRWRAAVYLLIAIAGAAVFVVLIKKLIHRARPISVYDGIVQYSFPSGHACMSIVLYGFLAFLLAYGAPRMWRRSVAFGALVMIGFIAFSRIYLGAHWLSDVLAGLSFGAGWVGLLMALYVHNRPAAVLVRALGAAVISTLLVAGTLHMMRDYGREEGRYTARPAQGPDAAQTLPALLQGPRARR